VLNNLDIVIVGNKRKEIITSSSLGNMPFRIFYTEDYTLPNGVMDSDWIPDYAILGAYRCFRGHIDAIASSTEENILVLEDDITIVDPFWPTIVESSLDLLQNFEVVNLHMRLFREHVCKHFVHSGLDFLSPIPSELLDSGKNVKRDLNKFYGVAALAYLVNRRVLPKLLNFSFDGTPIDILFWKEFSFCFIKKSPFLHDRRKGSLIEGQHFWKK
jgi:hypothetical protein